MEPTPNLGGVFVEGILEFSPSLAQPELRAGWILVPGTLRIGTGTGVPFPKASQAVITLVRDENQASAFYANPTSYVAMLESPSSAEYTKLEDALADRGLVIYASGRFRAYGWNYGIPWTDLAESAPAGAITITVRQSLADLAEYTALVDRLVLASSDFDADQAEVVTFSSMSQNSGNPDWTDLLLTAPLVHPHHGAVELSAHHPTDPKWQIEERAEVGHLRRNVVVRAQELTNTGWQDGTGHHGHVMLARGSHTTEHPEGRFWWVRFEHLGVRGKLGRYPLHFHETGDQASVSWIKYCVFEENWNKFLSIHATQAMTIEGNVGYKTFGNGFFLEDADARNISLKGNLGLGVERPEPFSGDDPVGDEDKEPGVFWFVSADNRIEGNHAAGSSHYGFWYSPEDDDAFTVDGVNSYFRQNVAHSNGHHGIYQDKVASNAASPRARPWYAVTEDPNTHLYTGQFQWEGCSSWKNRRYGVWIRSFGRVVLDDMKVADNRSGFYAASNGVQDVSEYTPADWRCMSWITIQDSLAIGETDNRGDFPAPNATSDRKHEEQAGRTLPQPVVQFDGNRPHAEDWAYLTGVDFYDGLVDLRALRFAHFKDLPDLVRPTGGYPSDRKAAAVSQVAYDSLWAEDPRNQALQLEFDQNGSSSTVDHRVAFRQVVTSSPANMIRNTVVHDEDGSLNASGFGDAFVVPETPFLVEGVQYYDADPLDGVWEVARADAEYAQVVVLGEYGRDGIGWIGVAHGYPAPANPVYQLVRTVLGNDSPTSQGQSQDQFPFNLPLNKQYFLDFRDDNKQVVTPHDAVDFEVRFASATGQWVILGFPWDNPSPVVKHNDVTLLSAPDINAFLASTSTTFYYHDLDNIPSTQNNLLIKVFSELRSGGTDPNLLLKEGTENEIRVR